jgi:class 3 adenylate cyclase/tetratricopeptide (TPR) repeat protein
VSTCAACGYENRNDARFCGGCGARLREAEPVPRVPLARDLRAYTPRHLIERILQTRAAIEGERKQVTVLFADIKGSMDLAEEIDPEAWHRIMDRFFAILADGVHRFEGTVNQYTGDGIMALFGAPLAHEDHAQRACYTALYLSDGLRRYAQDLRRERGFDLSVRLGLNSGEVIVGKIGDDLRMDYTAHGHTVGLAARMEQLAEAGRIYLTEHTATIVSGFFRLEDLGLFTIKGVHAPLRVYSLLGPGPLQSRFELAQARGLSRFVGRGDEMRRLERMLDMALDGSGQVVGIVGDAGVGKSRLCFELVQGARARGIVVHQTHCVSHGATVPFLPLLELVRAYFGISEQDSDDNARRKIAGTVLLLDAELTESLPLLFDFLGVPDPERPVPQLDPVARQKQLFGCVVRLLDLRSQREPTIVLFEDLHWIDGGSQAFLDALIDAMPATRLLLLLNFRLEYRLQWSEHAAYQHFALAPLAAPAIAELLADLLGPDPALADLADRLREHTEGNPFFLEEVVRSLIDHAILVPVDGNADPRPTAGRRYVLTHPVTDVQIPATVQAVLAARIDRLGEREKKVLQTAAVIGKRFWEPVLRRLLDLSERELAEALHVLSSGEFVYADAMYPETEYAFTHPLTREVAYHSQLAERRARVHADVARALLVIDEGRLDERAAVLAHHWERAGEALEAARWSRRAAEWVRVSDLPESTRHWHKVHDLLAPLAPAPERDGLALEACIRLLETGWRLGIPDADAAALWREGEALALRTAERGAHARLISAYGSVTSHRGRADEWIGLCKHAAGVADDTDDEGVCLAMRSRLAQSLAVAGRLAEALDIAENTLATPPADTGLGANVLGYSPYVRLVEQRARILIEMGRLEEAIPVLTRAVQLAHTRSDLEVLGWTHGEYVSLARIRGDGGTALTHSLEAMRLAERLGSPFFRAAAALSYGQAHILAGQWAAALAALEEARGIARVGQGSIETEGMALAWIAAAHLGLRDSAAARTAADAALGVARERRTRLVECIAQIGRARVYIRTDGVRGRATIEEALEQALALVEETGAASNAPFIRVQRARLAALQGDARGWHQELQTAQQLFLEMGATARAAALPVSPRPG